MDYESLFSPSVKRKIRLIVEQSENSALMTERVKADFGDAAISLARQIAAETKGFIWLRQDVHNDVKINNDRLTDSAVNTNAVAQEKLSSNAKYFDIGTKAKKFARLAWSKVSIYVWILAIVVALYNFLEYKKAQNIIDEKNSVGTLATVAGSMIASAYKGCKLIGLVDFDDCSKTTGILVQDLTAKQLAILATKQGNKYTEICNKHYSKEFCADQLNRAFQLGMISEK